MRRQRVVRAALLTGALAVGCMTLSPMAFADVQDAPAVVQGGGASLIIR